MKCYNVIRLRNSNFECNMKSHLDYESAKKIAEWFNSKNDKPEVSYEVIKHLVPMTTEELFDRYGDSVCELCKLNGHCKLSPGNVCEGEWCEVAADEFADENNIELTN